MLRLIAYPLLALADSLDAARERAERRHARRVGVATDARDRLVTVRTRQRSAYQHVRRSVFGGFLLVDDDGGQVAFGFMLLMIVVFMFFALAVDTGIWALDHRSAQNQADAAAHAGALALLMGDDPQLAARQALARNGVPSAEAMACDDGWYDRDGDRVEVCLRRSSQVIFSALTGVLDIKVSARAAAEVVQLPGGSGGLYSLMVMGETGQTLTMNGNSEINVDGGGMTYVRSEGDPAVRMVGNASVDSGGNEVVGTVSANNGNAQMEPPAVQGIPQTDPLAGLAQPTIPSVPNEGSVNVSGNNSRTLNPGRYSSVNAQANSELTFLPGTYVFDGAVSFQGNAEITFGAGVYIFRNGLSVTGNADLFGENVLFYRTCPAGGCSGGIPGSFSFAGNGELSLSGREDHGNILIWVDRNAPDDGFSLHGNANWEIDGIVYAPSTSATFAGNAESWSASFLVRTLDIAGNGELNLVWSPEHGLGTGVEPAIALVE